MTTTRLAHILALLSIVTVAMVCASFCLGVLTGWVVKAFNYGWSLTL